LECAIQRGLDPEVYCVAPGEVVRLYRGRDRVRVATILARKKLGFTLAGFAS
jgi:hypothetical protein